MLYKFKSRNAGELIMLERDGDHLLRLIGKSPSEQGIIQAADIPSAISSLQVAIEHEEAVNKAEGLLPSEGPGLRHRAVPFIQMLRLNDESGDDIVWGV